MSAGADAADWVNQVGDLVAVWDGVRIQATVAAPVPQVDEWASALAQLSLVRDSIVASGGWAAGPANLMDVLGLSRAEGANCQVVRWLLDPAARHGIGAALLRRLAMLFDLQAVDIAACRVESEVSRERSRADIVCSGFTGGTLVIEAKVDAPEGDAQGLRLEEDWPEAVRFVFLTIPGGRIPWTAKDTGRWSTLSWRWLADAVEAAIGEVNELPDSRSQEARHAAQEWALAARRHLA